MNIQIEPEYKSLEKVLLDALYQAQNGKGRIRHANAREPFEKQKICEITRRVGIGYPLGQAIKKAEESTRLPNDRAINELLGAINYLAAAIIVFREEMMDAENNQPSTLFFSTKG